MKIRFVLSSYVGDGLIACPHTRLLQGEYVVYKTTLDSPQAECIQRILQLPYITCNSCADSINVWVTRLGGT